MTASAKPLPDLYGVADALDGVVGIDQENAVVGHRLRVRAERFNLAVEAHDPAMRVRAFDGNAEEFSSQHVAGCDAAADVGGATGAHRAVDALRAAQAELDDRLPSRRLADARRFGR